jgi:hypothetical protein
MPGRWRCAHGLMVMLFLTGLVGFSSPRAVNASGPLGLTAVPGKYSVYLTWSTIQGANSYQIQVWDPVVLKFDAWASVNGSASSYLGRDLSPAKPYEFRVQAFNGATCILEDTVAFMTMAYEVWVPQIKR